MRKFLLTTAAALGAAVALAGVAQAQSMGPVAPTFTYPVAPAQKGGPNSFQVHLDGRINWYAGVTGSSVDNATVGFTDTGEPITNKLNSYDFTGYIRLYPGFDAVAANGLKYGVAAEIRMPGAGGGTIHGDSPPSSTETLFWRRAYGYVGTDELGTFRFGMGDSVQTLFQTGTFEDFNDGGWNGDVPALIPGNAQPVFPWADTGTLYTTDKIVYLSPNFSGFQFGAGFAPNVATLYNSSGCTSGSADTGCNRLASTGIPGFSARPRNTVDVGVQYANTFSGVGINAGLTYIASTTVSSPPVVAGTDIGKFIGYSVGAAGLTLSYAGVTVGGHVTFGQQNFDYALMPEGGQDTVAWLVGAEYTTGPFVVGASWFQTKMSGNWAAGLGVNPDGSVSSSVARTETDEGLAIGGTYSVAPGMVLFLSYLYGQRHQIGWDFVSSTPGVDSNNAHSNAFAIGTQLKW